MSLKEEIVSMARGMGVDKVGFTTRERLADAPPSGDMGYLLPSARSAVSLVVALDKATIRAYLTWRTLVRLWMHCSLPAAIVC